MVALIEAGFERLLQRTGRICFQGVVHLFQVFKECVGHQRDSNRCQGDKNQRAGKTAHMNTCILYDLHASAEKSALQKNTVTANHRVGIIDIRPENFMRPSDSFFNRPYLKIPMTAVTKAPQPGRAGISRYRRSPPLATTISPVMKSDSGIQKR